MERGGDSCPAGGDDRDANFPVAAGFGQDWKETDMEGEAGVAARSRQQDHGRRVSGRQ